MHRKNNMKKKIGKFYRIKNQKFGFYFTNFPVTLVNFFLSFKFWRELAADALCPMCNFVSSAHQYCFVFRVSHFIQLARRWRKKTKCFVLCDGCGRCCCVCVRVYMHTIFQGALVCVRTAARADISLRERRMCMCAALLDTCVLGDHMCVKCSYTCDSDSLAAAAQTIATWK